MEIQINGETFIARDEDHAIEIAINVSAKNGNEHVALEIQSLPPYPSQTSNAPYFSITVQNNEI